MNWKLNFNADCNSGLNLNKQNMEFIAERAYILSQMVPGSFYERESYSTLNHQYFLEFSENGTQNVTELLLGIGWVIIVF